MSRELSLNLKLDPILHQPVRTRIAAYLAARGSATFTELKKELDVTDGNLEAHMKKLTAAKYIAADRTKRQARPQTIYRLSKAGTKAFQIYVDALQNWLNPVSFD